MSSEQHDNEAAAQEETPTSAPGAGDETAGATAPETDDSTDDVAGKPAKKKRFGKATKAETAPRDGADRHWASSLALASGSVALVGAVACLGYFGYTGISAYIDAANKTSQLRDDSIDAAEQAILNVTNIDVDDIDGWEKRLQSSLTGAALKQTQDGQVQDLKKQLAAGQRVNAQLVATISRAAATEVNVDENQATVLVFSTSTAQGSDGAAAGQVPMEFLVTVVEADGVRKASNIVPLSDMSYLEETPEPEGGR